MSWIIILIGILVIVAIIICYIISCKHQKFVKESMCPCKKKTKKRCPTCRDISSEDHRH